MSGCVAGMCVCVYVCVCVCVCVCVHTHTQVPRRASRLSWRERRERGQSEGGEITETSPLKSSELDSSTEV